ncbi:4894_t:CDS:1 [Diversispora eburnea]|uniref:Succinate dehydrogenase assembly factor 4, mitochondrial n=1 Tax=Diversispora eburnea TaxID=1213867 RepID=A0A9N9BT45_9GLOM|nr:4894_t:CDS:1 [Diversispora eburnea]
MLGPIQDFRMSLIRIRRLIFPQFSQSRLYSNSPDLFRRPSPVPLGNPEEQKEFEELVRKNQGSFNTETEETDEKELHPDLREKPSLKFEGDKNPLTGEIGGPRQDPLMHGDWSYGSRVTDF